MGEMKGNYILEGTSQPFTVHSGENVTINLPLNRTQPDPNILSLSYSIEMRTKKGMVKTEKELAIPIELGQSIRIQEKFKNPFKKEHEKKVDMDFTITIIGN
jgi:hypothetical protein